MNLMTLIIAFGVATGLIAIAVVLAFDRLRRGTGTRASEPVVPKTFMGGLGIGSIAGPTDMLARLGQNDQPRMTLNTVVMIPTTGLRIMSLGGTALLLFLLWGPYLGDLVPSILFQLGLTAVLIYAALFIAGYEARYDETGITAPNWLFQDVHYPWEELITIKDNSHHLYVMKFECGTLQLQKYLVGMPAFLSFVAGLRRL